MNVNKNLTPEESRLAAVAALAIMNEQAPSAPASAGPGLAAPVSAPASVPAPQPPASGSVPTNTTTTAAAGPATRQPATGGRVQCPQCSARVRHLAEHMENYHIGTVCQWPLYEGIICGWGDTEDGLRAHIETTHPVIQVAGRWQVDWPGAPAEVLRPVSKQPSAERKARRHQRQCFLKALQEDEEEEENDEENGGQ
ncbi:hypothetical protein GGR57DRAFT_518861 [Xylariaceae sp. FL1272]|nr:hypothetical protein GGR57DRAFT_518861 [Xylariaceae sp. FL1272]